MRSISLWTAVAVSVFIAGCRQTPMKRLIAASRGVRVAEARLCGFAYASMPRVHRGAADAEPPAPYATKAVAAELVQTDLGSDIDARHARAISRLVDGHPDAAAKDLDELVRVNPRSARTWSDLAAIRYEIARHANDAQGFASALAAAASARDADPSLPEAHFNYALAAAALHLDDTAAASLKKYLTLDGSSGWAAEARQRVHVLERPKPDWKRTAARIERPDAAQAEIQKAVADFPQQARTWAEGEYLARWAEAFRTHRDAEAEHWLSLSRSIGAALLAKSGESLLPDAVAAIDTAAPSHRAQLADAHLTYRRGRKAYGEHKPGEAIPILEESERRFGKRSPMGLAARLYRANATTDVEQPEKALAMLASLSAEAKDSYLALRALILWQQGYATGRMGHLYESFQAGQSALLIFEKLGENENSAQMLTNMASVTCALGQTSEGWRLSRRAFELASASGNPLLAVRALHATARNELRESNNDVARALLEIERSMPQGSPRLRVDALVQSLNVAPDSTNIADLRAAAGQIADPALREEALDDVRFATAVRSATPAATSTTLLSQCLAYRTATARVFTLPETYLARAEAYRRLGNDRLASVDIDSALTAIENVQTQIVPDDIRDSFVSAATHAYRAAVDVRVARADYRGAFAITERWRARTLQDQLTKERGLQESLTIDEIASRLPAATAVAQYTFLDDKVVILTISRRGFDAHVVPARDVRKHLRTDDPEQDRELYGLLIAPLARELSDTKILVVIPDETVAPISFAALRASAGPYLVESHAVVFSPSASAFVSNAETKQPASRRRALIVGNPAFDRDRFPTLPPLAGAEAEANRIARLYDSTVLTGVKASPARVTKELASCEVVHIGAHALVNERDPSVSLLVLAPEPGGETALYLRDIVRLRLPKRPLIVLAGCETALSGRGHGSTRSLALAFLAAGSRQVIASLWDVDDESTRDFSLLLHQALARGERPAIALQQAQVAMLRSGGAARTWAAFQIYGSV